MLEGHLDGAVGVSFSPDGTRVGVSRGGGPCLGLGGTGIECFVGLRQGKKLRGNEATWRGALSCLPPIHV